MAVLNLVPKWMCMLALSLSLLPGLTAQASDTGINIGDMLAVDVYRRPELSTTVQVSSNGDIDMPYIGTVAVAGMNEKEAAAHISSALKIILKNPRVTVSRGGSFSIGSPRTADMKTQIITLNNSKAELLSEQLQGMSSDGGSISCFPDTNSLIITDTPSVISSIVAAVTQLDQMPALMTQVRIEAKIAEIKEGAMKDIGVRWFAQGSDAGGGYYPENPALSSPGPSNEQLGSPGNNSNDGGMRFVDGPQFDRRLNVPVQIPVAGQMFFGLLTGTTDIGIFLDALVKNNDAELLASPNILTVNHKQAEIKMADEVPYTESSATFGTVNYNVKFMDLGIKLFVTPHVYRDPQGNPYVQLELEPEVSSAVGMNNGVPVRSVRSSKNVSAVRNGQTLVIGGIVMNDEQKVNQRVPGLGKIPLIGGLFRHKETKREKTELMVFVTPTIHETPESVTWDKMINLTGAGRGSLPVPPAAQDAANETRKE